MIYAGIVAGGSGSRMGLDVPKQYVHIGDMPVLMHTIKKFTERADRIYIACPEKQTAYTAGLVAKYVPDHAVTVIPGGKTRMESLLNILAHIKRTNGIKEDDIILTHDGVRPFVTPRIIEENLALAGRGYACGTFLPAVDTVALSTDGKKLQKIPPRDTMYLVQTPQTFPLLALAELFAKSGDTMEQYTDLCGLALAGGVQVRIVVGDPCNIKLTTPLDLRLAEELLKGETI